MAFCRWFGRYSETDYARSGNLATQTVTIDKGALEEFSHALEPQLRKLGLPTVLQKGKSKRKIREKVEKREIFIL